jgi:hypothetical protein
MKELINEIVIDDRIYKMVCIFSADKSRDSKGDLFPLPKEGKGNWTFKKQLLNRLNEIETFLEQKFMLHNSRMELIKPKDCLLCSNKSVATKRFILDNYIWEDSLYHYIDVHNIKPPDIFIDKLFKYNIINSTPIKILGEIESEYINFIKLDRNQIMILDALMKHGGYTKKYVDKNTKNLFRYSEHVGFFHIERQEIDKIIVSGQTLRVDRGDEEIYLPGDIPDAFEYEYIFHTHPPTPKPGGRVKDGILYEFPSTGDMIHFIEHFNEGKTIGSLVMTAEGLYNIRKLYNDSKIININENKFYDEVKKTLGLLQKKAINKYGENFTNYEFYSKISQDIQFIDLLNNKLNKYGITIDFYPRVKDLKGSWIVDTIYLPI